MERITSDHERAVTGELGIIGSQQTDAGVPASSDVTITVACRGAETLQEVLTFPTQLKVARQVGPDLHASYALLDRKGVWRLWKLQPSLRDPDQGFVPRHGSSTLTVRIEASGAQTFVDEFCYEVRYAAWCSIQSPHQEWGIQFIPVGKKRTCWKWSLILGMAAWLRPLWD